MCKVISVANQKGGVGKTTTTINLGIGLAKKGQRVLLIDADPQGSTTHSLGIEEPDDLEYSLASVLGKIINEDDIDYSEGIITHDEGIDYMPGNIELSGIEVSLVNVMCREGILKMYLNQIRDAYDYILIDCMSSLGMLTVNALVAADTVLIPVQTHYLSAKGLEQLVKTIGKIKRQLNPKLKIEGILPTIVNERTINSREMLQLLQKGYGKQIRIFGTCIPEGVKAPEASALGISVYKHDSHSKVSMAYEALTREVLAHE